MTTTQLIPGKLRPQGIAVLACVAGGVAVTFINGAVWMIAGCLLARRGARDAPGMGDGV